MYTQGSGSEYELSTSSTAIVTVCPPLSRVLEDLQLIQNTDASSTSESHAVAELVLVNAAAAVHAHAIQQLLGAVLPLSTDIDYWSAQDSDILAQVLYFVQTLPHRLFCWCSEAAQIVYGFSTTQNQTSGSLFGDLWLLLSSRSLFPETGQLMSDGDSDNGEGGGRQDLQQRLRLSVSPKNIKLLALVRHEIRYKLQQLMSMQHRLAASIGILSQSVVDKGTYAYSCESAVVLLMQQVSEAVNSLEGGRDFAETADTLQNGNIAIRASAVQYTAERIQKIMPLVSSKVGDYSRPSLATRCWIPAVATLLGARWMSRYIAGHRNDLREWASDAVYTLRNYVSQYILAPLRSGYETIRYGKHTYSVMTQESLASDFESLENMVTGFASRFGSVNPAEIRQRLTQGDLSDVMRVYTREMQQPFRNVIFGDLIQAMLIQVQKVKVDVGQTMAALDKLLKSNELNFLLLSTVPATLSIYAAVEWLSSRFSWWVSGGKRNMIISLQLVVRDIDRLLNQGVASNTPTGDEMAQLPAVDQGRLICLTHYLRYHALRLPNSASAGRLRTETGWSQTLPFTRTLFLQDICDMESAELGVLQKRNVIERMYKTFRFL
ncbi:NCA2-domain-containing protein [Coemansia reversa NRRL 1564]|uniref:NCA2-domain-containing protein n=1 Tax=Coemansia reversa (strain ATCC 12441 / NRRL 1564) TaxID=763665 RepID=A0A2G5BCW4_COERN|nr:NCA2-domain-containing protein [Coemansia reversa NRRL 1564]|eukprot:PIA16557.1 NCA2-domain-containing protein [Coemansia reversa NRRL 1564]